jgi:pimeloyl-ACP methyl ester carboxylesterase
VLVAGRNPGHVRGVVVVDAGLKSPFASIPDQQRRQFMEFLNGSPENYDLFVKRMFTALGRDSAQGVEIHSRAARVPSLNMRTYFRELMFMDYSETAKQLSTPLLYVGSSRSWADTLSWATVARERGLEGIAGAVSRRIPDSGHLIMSDQPDSLAAAIADFTRRAIASK